MGKYKFNVVVEAETPAQAKKVMRARIDETDEDCDFDYSTSWNIPELTPEQKTRIKEKIQSRIKKK